MIRLIPKLRQQSELISKRTAVDHFFDSFIDEFVSIGAEKETQGSGFKVDIEESSNEYLLIAELPGYTQKEIKIEYKDKYLTISTQREVKNGQSEIGFKCIRRERATGKLSRSFYIDYIQDEGIEATLKEGLLYVKLKKQFI